MKWLGRASLLLDRNLMLGTLLERLADIHGNRHLATESGDELRHWTYRSAADVVDRAAASIAAKAHIGDRVVIATPNSYDMFLLSLGAIRAGAIAVPVNPAMTPAEVDYVIADSGAALTIRSTADVVPDGLPAPVPGEVVESNKDVAAIFYSSGTTGKPKGARLSHRALIGQARTGLAWPASVRRDEAVAGLPIAHIMGFTVALGLAIAGIPLFNLPRFRPNEALDAIEQRRATMFIGVPAMYRLMLEAGAQERDLRSVRVWASGADAMPTELARTFQRMGATATLPIVGASVGEALFVEGYGMVEVGGGAAAKVMPPGFAGPLANVLGVPLPSYRFKVVRENGDQVGVGEVGELLIKGPGVLSGYHGDAEATSKVLTPDGWLRTGDLARRGPLGFVAFEGRDKDVIKVGGYSVYALEVQGVLEQHDAVAEAVVVGIDDERMGERAVAVVRLMPGGATSESDLVDWCGSRLASYKVPTKIRIVDDLPRTGTSKVRKDEVRAMFRPGYGG